MKQKLMQLSENDLHLLQKKSLEIAKYVVEFCKKRNIRVYFFAGSLLGAVRHHGFIPWDDDIDMIFPAPDFDKFIIALDRVLTKTGIHYVYKRKIITIILYLVLFVIIIQLL